MQSRLRICELLQSRGYRMNRTILSLPDCSSSCLLIGQKKNINTTFFTIISIVLG